LPDIVDPQTRSRMMSGIRGKDTKPELVVRKALHALGFRYRLHPKEAPGKPDFVLSRYRAAVFVHGCFWHGHNCSLFRLPSTRTEFWKAKIDGNRTRDAVVLDRLQEQGYRTLVIWECSFRGPDKIGLEATVSETAGWIKGASLRSEIRGRT
jgi:DNA mismatch endonuclease, patch repair protein